MRTSPVWSPEQYGTYADERGRPYADLVGRVRAADVRAVVDLGCGPGGLTVTLREVWPEATIVGVDNSPQMLEAAQQFADERLSFELGDVREWAVEPGSVVDGDLRIAVPPTDQSVAVGSGGRAATRCAWPLVPRFPRQGDQGDPRRP